MLRDSGGSWLEAQARAPWVTPGSKKWRGDVADVCTGRGQGVPERQLSRVSASSRSQAESLEALASLWWPQSCFSFLAGREMHVPVKWGRASKEWGAGRTAPHTMKPF